MGASTLDIDIVSGFQSSGLALADGRYPGSS